MTASTLHRTRVLALAMVSALLAFSLSGCELNPLAAKKAEASLDLNGEAALLVQEMQHMSAVSGSNTVAAKTSAGVPDTEYVYKDITPSTYDSSCACRIRTETIKTDEGNDRERIDSIFYKDANGNPLHYRNFEKLKSVHHVRRITHKNGGKEAQIRIVTDMTVAIGSDTTGTWNGTISGSYDGEEFKTGTISNVVRKFTNGHWDYPESGTVSVDRPKYTHQILFLGDGRAKATRTEKKTGNTTVIMIDRNFRPSL